MYPRSLVILSVLWAMPAVAQVTVTDINPSQSTRNDVGSAGRVNHLGRGPDGITFYAATEWGGLYKSTDAGVTWFHLDAHLPTATWDVKVDPQDVNKVYATSFYDGRITSLGGINVSTDGGATWVHPPTATPPIGLCAGEERRDNPSAFGIAIDPLNTQHVVIGTNCGLATSSDGGATWQFIDPTPDDHADDVWSVVIHDKGIIDLCGDDTHQRSVDKGQTWTSWSAATFLPAGRCSIAVSPDEPYVLFGVAGTTLYESDDGGSTWPIAAAIPSPYPNGGGRIPFVVTNKRSGRGFDLWLGDVKLFTVHCSTPQHPRPGGNRRCPAPPWSSPYTGGHVDVGDVVFDPLASTDACPALFANDGGVFRNAKFGTGRGANSGCQSPVWSQPSVSPHALWLWTLDGIVDVGLGDVGSVFIGTQDNASFATGVDAVHVFGWTVMDGGDVFDVSALGLSSFLFTTLSGPQIVNGLWLRRAPGIPLSFLKAPVSGGFTYPDAIGQFSSTGYAIIAGGQVLLSDDVTASPVVWRQLGSNSLPDYAVALKVAFAGATPTFLVQVEPSPYTYVNGSSQSQIWRFTGTGAGSWKPVKLPPGGGGLGVFTVDPHSPNRLFASYLQTGTDPTMVFSENGGAQWVRLPGLDQLMTGGGVFRYQNPRGPTEFTAFGGYAQPTLVAIDPQDPKTLVAGAADAGLFVSRDNGNKWQLVTDPIRPAVSGTPHLPRPRMVYFRHEDPENGRRVLNLYVGTEGRGVWKVTLVQ